MQHPDEGTIHAWLDGALSDAEAAAVEAHVRDCTTCAAATAEARGLIAAASRILGQLDDVPAGVLPASVLRQHTPWFRRVPLQAAAGLIIAALGMTWVFRDHGVDARMLKSAVPPSSAVQPKMPEPVAPAPSTVERYTLEKANAVRASTSQTPDRRRVAEHDALESHTPNAVADAAVSSVPSAATTANTAAPAAIARQRDHVSAPVREQASDNVATRPLTAEETRKPSVGGSVAALAEETRCGTASVTTYAIRSGVNVTLVRGDSAVVASPQCIAAGTPPSKGEASSNASGAVMPGAYTRSKVPDVRSAARPAVPLRTSRWIDPETKRVSVLRGYVSDKELEALRQQIEQ